MTLYPAGSAARDRFVLARRPPRPPHDPWQSHAVLVEDELAADRTVVGVGTVFLTGRECPWRCVMCDLWRHTTERDTPDGAIAAQVANARRTLDRSNRPVSQIKLYNAGSFFDPRAVPDDDYEGVAAAVAGLSRVIVESHPALIGARTRRFLEALHAHQKALVRPTLEVAIGLETGHPEALERLNKRMTTGDFLRAASRLRSMGVALRVFLLVSPPFVPNDEQDEWLLRSIDLACEAGATAVSLIPTRPGNGALDALEEDGLFRRPLLLDLERSLTLALARVDGRETRVFADLWDVERFAECQVCLMARRERLRAMNVGQRFQPPVSCPRCDAD
jgi:radical SAM enzyme (TIGR01210 family)